MRRRAKVDANQPDIVKALRDVGASVEPLHMVGKNFPDLVVGFRGRNYLIEVKDGEKKPSERRLSEGQKEFHESWKGQIAKVETIDDALHVIGAIK